MNEYLAVDSGGYFYKQPWLDASHEKLRWCLVEQVCQVNKV